MVTALRSGIAVALVVGGVAIAVAADAPYVGKWKFNAAKSQLAGSTYSIENAPGGLLHFDLQGFAYDFKTDGKEYAAPDGSMNIWTAISPTQWDLVSKLNGKVTANYSIVVKGNTASLTFSMKKPDGTSIDSSTTYTRVSGGPGMLGKWRSTDVKPPAVMVDIAATGDGISWKDDTGYAFSGKFDGKDNAPGGTMAGSKFTLALRKISDRSFEMTTRIDGKPFAVDTFTVSADGKTLTDNSVPVNAKSEATKLVYDKQ
jgi:hypothetical protein